MRTFLTTLPAAGLLVVALSAPAARAHAAGEDDPGVRSAKAAAHASLIDRADVPDHPPRLPDSKPEPSPRALHGASRNGNRGEAIRKAKVEAQQQVEADVHAARADAANRAATGAAASTARSNNADERAAAGQARARAARAAAGKPDHPGGGPPPGKGPQN